MNNPYELKTKDPMQDLQWKIYDAYRSNTKYIKIGEDCLPNPYYVDVNKLDPETNNDQQNKPRYPFA